MANDLITFLVKQEHRYNLYIKDLKEEGLWPEYNSKEEFNPFKIEYIINEHRVTARILFLYYKDYIKREPSGVNIIEFGNYFN